MLQPIYDPFQPRVLPIFIYYFFVVTFGLVVSIKMFLKWRERKVKPPLYLALVFTCLTLSLLSLLIGLSEAVITKFYMEIYRLSLPLGYIFVILADIFLFLFAIQITNKGKKALIPIILVGFIIIILILLPWNWFGVPDEVYEGQINIRLYTTLAFVVYSLLIYIYIALITRKVKKNVDDKIMYIGLKLLFYSMISLMLLFLMLISDVIMITLFDNEGYTIFIYIGWVFGMIFIILSYLSLIMPEWLKKRIKKKYKL